MFQAILPSTGYIGWRFLERSLETQQEILSESAPIARATDYFREKIGAITSAKDLVADRQLLTVALGAFGLDDDIDNKFFIQKILGEGTTDPDALANKLADDRYQKFANAFGFDQFSGANTQYSAFTDEVIQRYTRGAFEVAVGDSDEDMRSALYAKRELTELATSDGSQDTKWFLIMGTPPLRKVFETALNLPSGLANIDLDQQLEVFKEQSERRFGTADIKDFEGEAMRERLVEQYLLQSQLNSGGSLTGMSIALTLLQS
jgi:hypothetical protein